VILTVSRFEVAREFYRKLRPEFGMKPVFDGDKLFYCVGARTAIGIEPCDPALAGERFVQRRVGLHHLCLRARSRDDVDRCAALLKEMNATIVRGPMEGSWAPTPRRRWRQNGLQQGVPNGQGSCHCRTGQGVQIGFSENPIFSFAASEC
jgi:catechol 2,3-dioxygenase-like lactoylglutathione lyase family enzyme